MDPLVYEEWRVITEKSVPDVKANVYYISNFGRVWSSLRNVLLNPTQTLNGYYRVCLRLNNGDSRYYSIHRILMIEFYCIDNYQEMQVNHNDGKKDHNFYFNLEWATCSENINHAYRTGLKTQFKGEDCTYATITNEQAEFVAQLITQQKYTHQEIADIVGCPKHIVRNIATGATWKWVYDKYNLGKYKKPMKLLLSDEQIHQLCEYFQSHKDIQYKSKSDLYRDALRDLFGIEFNTNMSATMGRIYGRQTRTNISDNYDF